MYDEELANRVREQFAGEDGVSEKRMFGGLAFLLGGNMALAVSGRGGLMVRVGSDGAEEALARPHASQVEMRGRPMTGWVFVALEGVRTRRQLQAWVARGVAVARTLPAKGSRDRRSR
jgi:TfoX/Sxy family transcriptional regulator of competence genes